MTVNPFEVPVLAPEPSEDGTPSLDFEESEWPTVSQTNPFTEAVTSLTGTTRALSVTAPDERTRDRWVNQLHRAGRDAGVTVRTRARTTPDNRFRVHFRVVEKQTRTPSA